MKKLGRDYRLWVETAVAGTYAEVKGNQELSIGRDGSTIDLGTKSDFPYSPQAAGGRSLSVSASFIPDLPDAGYTRFMSLANGATTTPIPIQIRKGGATGADPGDVVLEVDTYATQLNDDFGQAGGVGSAWTLVAAAAPTVDLLA